MRYRKTQTTNKKYSKKLLFSLICLVLIGLMILVVLELTHTIDLYRRSNVAKTTSAPQSTNSINYDPPTENEKQQADDKKQEIIEDTENPPSKPSSAQVVIVDAAQYDDQVEIRAFASNVIENGTCTYTFTQAELRVEKEVPAYADASTTPCINAAVPVTEFPQKGTWQLTVTYENNTITGSATQEITIE